VSQATQEREPAEGAIGAKPITQELREASDATIEEAVQFADPMVLRGLLHQLTGDEAVAATRTAPVEFLFLEIQTVTDPDDLALLHRRAAELLKSLRDQDADEVSVGPRERLRRSLGLASGIELDDCEAEMWEEQTGLDPWARGLAWESKPAAERLEEFKVIVIGAGMGGLNAAVLLQQAGLSFTVLEKNPEVGGTWYENRYPGARVDNPSRTYSHVFGADFDWASMFSVQPENERYFNWVADRFAVRDSIEFDTEVDSIEWLEQEGEWEVRATGPAGERILRANGVISAVGFLSRANLPEIEGAEEFEGRAFHTSRWPADLDISGKRVAVIGSGCSGYQLVPTIVEDAERTYLFQRTPNWTFGVEGYLSDHPEQATWLDRNLPFHTNFSRFRISWLFGPESLRAAYEVDPSFEDEHGRSPHNKRLREQQVAFIEGKLASRPELLEKMTPVAPPLSSRPVICDADYNVLDALVRDDAELVDTGIARITREGIETGDGRQIPLDVIVFATGFKASDFLWPMSIRGREGVRLEELWEKDGPRAYLGTMLPGFPNFFMVYGPNTNPYAGGAPVDFEELVTRFALECFRGLIEGEKKTVDVTEDAYWRYNDELDRWEEFKVYMDPRTRSYFHNEHGRSPANGPIDMRRIWSWLRSPTGRSSDQPPIYRGGPVEEGPELRPHFGEDLIVE
jgi:4-hydroxyacetophenone monooxygenase